MKRIISYLLIILVLLKLSYVFFMDIFISANGIAFFMFIILSVFSFGLASIFFDLMEEEVKDLFQRKSTHHSRQTYKKGTSYKSK